MRHVNTIRKIIDDGQIEEAYVALDNLLSLGPNNVEALKLQAMLSASEGKFNEEALIWKRITAIDREDPDAINYIFKQQSEDREHYYFTDDIPGGGRRYLAYPRKLITSSMIGLFGCVIFLLLSKMQVRFPFFGEDRVLLTNFALLVIGPWVGILFTYFRALKAIVISPTGIEISTRLRSFKYSWSDLKHLYLTHKATSHSPEIEIVLIPIKIEKDIIVLNLNEHNSSIRAKSHFIRELSHYSQILSSLPFDRVNLSERKLHRF